MSIILKPETNHLVMCSSYKRPNKIRNLIDSFKKTKRGNTELVIYVSDDDTNVLSYQNLIHDEDVHLVVDKHRWMPQVLNYLSCQLFPNMKYYSEVNDDHEYVTDGWDLIFMEAVDKNNGWGIVYGATHNLPTAIMVSSKIIKALGFMFPPEFIHAFVDDFIKEVGNATNLLIHIPNVVIKHNHFSIGLSEFDETYNSHQVTWEQSVLIYNNWQTKDKQKQIQILLEAIVDEKNG